MSVRYDRQRDWTLLYPNEVTDILVMVPREFKQNFYAFGNIIQSPLLFIWCYLPILLAIVRVFIQYVVKMTTNQQAIHSFWRLYFDTVGLLIGTTAGIKIHSRSEKVLRLFISYTAIVIGLSVANFIYIGYYDLTGMDPKLNTLEDLIASDLDICVTDQTKFYVEDGTMMHKKLRR